jgi:hypothetical protein
MESNVLGNIFFTTSFMDDIDESADEGFFTALVGVSIEGGPIGEGAENLTSFRIIPKSSSLPCSCICIFGGIIEIKGDNILKYMHFCQRVFIQ